MTAPNGGTSSGGPLSRWLARYHEALEQGETPPELRPEEMGVDEADLDRFRSFLHMLDRTLRPPDTSGPGRTIVDLSDGPTAASEEAALPQAIGRFQIEKKLGRGGFGIVFRAFDPGMGRWVALKIPRAEALLAPGVRRRFLGEAHVAAQLDHPNLVPVFEAGEAGTICYIASAYCEGPTLRRWIKAGNSPVEPRRAARLVLAMTRAVEHMHARGLLHCDLKPENILLDLPPDDEPDADPTPRITDFGLARLIDSPIGESTAAKAWGTPPYMAPEQIEQRREVVGPATDVYALGAILYELATGRPPHKAESPWELMRAVVADPPASPRSVNRSVPRDLGAIAMMCLEKRSRLRYPDAATLADDLECFLERRPTSARPLGPPAAWPAGPPATRPRRP
ncbi:serine/threonine-protein kinase [Planctomyces sp. SH-PL62]|uniref:serine/threonine-protein kinase n=1 Tax=Planctomyces sp. SH-PL62 TaxID=1636152 RepID=UPI00078DE514|nr:serine/threonine-protein kinase [Planctomyces sp. SH-PL62]AMV38484.1 Serine/threonine-protein kinase PrkC [Planctomyces sp. SH-PL62]